MIDDIIEFVFMVIALIARFVLFGLGAVSVRLVTLDRVRPAGSAAESGVSNFGTRRDARGVLEIGSGYVVLLGLAVFLGVMLLLR